MRTRNSLALDRSLRSTDSDGIMVVEMSRISKANICPYRGSEIPNWQALGLDPDRIYRLLRHPEELKKAAPTFDGKPLLIRHVAVTADLPNQTLWVGTLGQCTFEAPYLITRPLTVITAEAQGLIESDRQRELSAGYRYDADMTPGVYGGERYEGTMKNLRGNHVAIVQQGRAGSDVHVADQAMTFDTATIDAMVADAFKRHDVAATIRRAIRTSSRNSNMPRSRSTDSTPGYDHNTLFGLQYGDEGYDYGRPVRRRSPPAARQRRHAFDEVDHQGALEQLEKAHNHVSAVQSGSTEFDAERFGGYLKGALDCMSGGGEDELTEGERDRTAEEGRDDVGEVPPRSVVETTGSGNPRRPDGTGGKYQGGGRLGGSSLAPASTAPNHRKDFNSIAQGGADSALEDGFDFDTLMQRY